MNKRRNGVFILFLIAFIGGLASGRELLFNIAYLLGLLLIVSFVWSWSNINWVHLSRVTRSRRTQVGKPLEERFTVRNTSVIPKLWLEVQDFSTVPGHHASQVINGLGSRATTFWRVTTVCSERGRYQLGPMLLSSSDPFGFFPRERELPATSNVVVYPLTVDIQQFALPIGLLPGGDALRRRTHYVTTNASGVRDYAPGDSFSRIHWRSTARRDRLIVKEFELDPLADIWVVADMAAFNHVPVRRENEEELRPGELPIWMRKEEFKLPDTTEEYTVTIAASLAQHFLRRDRAVGLLAYGQTHEVIQPDRGERQLNRILETLAVLRAQGQIALEDALHAEVKLLPRGTTLIVVTTTTSERWLTTTQQLSRRGIRVVSVMVNPASFGGRRSSAQLASMLQASNMATYFVNSGDNLTQVLSAGKVRAGYYALA
jgi:uncharacterized protein (DUF58 family)